MSKKEKTIKALKKKLKKLKAELSKLKSGKAAASKKKMQAKKNVKKKAAPSAARPEISSGAKEPARAPIRVATVR